jgi:galactokinase
MTVPSLEPADLSPGLTPPRRVIAAFSARFGAGPNVVVRAPGRVNLIGEHTDYNDGFVLPMAIDRAVWIGLSRRDDDQVLAWSLDFDSATSFCASRLETACRRSATSNSRRWDEYLKGVAWALRGAGHQLRGWNGVICGDVPIGAGLSSSAAIEMAAARAFAWAAEAPFEPQIMARIGQRAENEWVGLRCGIMDQMISAAGRAGHALLIDCRSLETQQVPMPADAVVVVLDTMTRRELATSAYNERREECERAARFFGVTALRDVSPPQLNDVDAGLDEPARRRARHVVSENERTMAAAKAMHQADPQSLGKLMIESHQSLRDDFEVSSTNLDAMVEIAVATPGCFGARMTGAGFGGCAVALVDERLVELFAARVFERYRSATGLEPKLYVTRAANGADVTECRQESAPEPIA